MNGWCRECVALRALIHEGLLPCTLLERRILIFAQPCSIVLFSLSLSFSLSLFLPFSLSLSLSLSLFVSLFLYFSFYHCFFSLSEVMSLGGSECLGWRIVFQAHERLLLARPGGLVKERVQEREGFDQFLQTVKYVVLPKK